MLFASHLTINYSPELTLTNTAMFLYIDSLLWNNVDYYVGRNKTRGQ